MNQILAKLAEVLEMCEKLQSALDSKIRATDETAAQQKTLAEQLATKEVSLRAREDGVKVIEDIVALSKATEAQAEENTEEWVKIQSRLDALTAAEDRIVKDHSARETVLREKEAVVKGREDAVSEKEAKIEKVITTKIKEILKQ